MIISSNVNSISASPEKVKLYPDCICKIVGFHCVKGREVLPPSYSVVTSDILQDISHTDDEENFYLYTTNEYTFHRLTSLFFLIRTTMVDFMSEGIK